jgi:Ca2+-binding EF-hand superfamily protein
MFKKWKLVLATSAVLVGGTVGFAAAKGHRGHGDRKAMKEKFDLNKDGQLDDAERAQLKQAFGAMRAQKKAEMLQKHDANKNGALDPAERQAMKAARAEARFTKLDTNRDGSISRAEFEAGHQHRGGRGGMKQRP